MRIAEEPGDTLAAVRGKERALAALGGREGPLARWRELANLWCAAWFWPDPSDAPDRREYVALAAEIGGGTGVLPSQHANRRLAVAAATSRERRCTGRWSSQRSSSTPWAPSWSSRIRRDPR